MKKPINQVCHKGLGELVTTMKLRTETSAEIGDAVAFSSVTNISRGMPDIAPIGVVVAKRGSFVAVQVGGYIEFKCDDTSYDRGWVNITCDTDGKVKIISQPDDTQDTVRCIYIDQPSDGLIGVII